MAQEMEFHVQMATRRNVERGMTPEAAARQARLAFGSVESLREEARDAQRARSVEHVAADVRYAVRGLRRSPTFTTAAVLIMGLGIAASTAIYTVVDAVLLRRLPIPEPADFRYAGWEWSQGNDVAAAARVAREQRLLRCDRLRSAPRPRVR